MLCRDLFGHEVSVQQDLPNLTFLRFCKLNSEFYFSSYQTYHHPVHLILLLCFILVSLLKRKVIFLLYNRMYIYNVDSHYYKSP